MSRTFRRRKNTNLREKFSTGFDAIILGNTIYFLPKKGQELKRHNRYFHSEKYQKYSGYGPGWYRTLYYEKPFRQYNRAEIFKYFKNPEHEVILLRKPACDYYY